MSVTKYFAAILAVGLFLGTTVAAQAAHISLKDGGYWANAADWWGSSVPTSADYPDIGWGWSADGYNNVTCNLATATAVGRGVAVGFAGTGTLNMTGGTLTVENKYQLGNCNGDTNKPGTGTVNQSGGAVTQTGASYGIEIGVFSGDTGYYNLSGGTIDTHYLKIGMVGSGEFNQSGGTLSATQVVTVGTGSGPGKFEVEGNTAMITWSGSSATFGAKSTLSFVADANGVSDILLSSTSSGNLNIDAAALLSFDLTAMSTAANDILLIDNYASDAISGTFANYAEGDTVATFGDGSYYTLSYVYESGNDVAAANDLALVANAVPEPSTLALLAAGLFGLLAYAWRKRK